MKAIRTSNPALKDETFKGFTPVPASQAMTIEGTVHRAALLVGLVIVSAVAGLFMLQALGGIAMLAFLGAFILGFVVAIVTIFKKEWSPYTAPLYAILEGLVLGVISLMFEEEFPGIVLHAVLLTFGTLLALLLAYRSGVIQPSQNLRLGIFAATGAIVLVYLIDILLRLFGMAVPFINESGPLGILISMVIVCIAALNLVLDFDFIERGAAARAPRYMEWYAAFGLLVTLVWLYLEILRLLAKLRQRR